MAFLFHRAVTQILCVIGSLLLISIAGSTLLPFWFGAPLHDAFAASSCPISGLPPTPTSAPSNDPGNIKLNELLSNPKKDWDCDGDTGAKNQWIELTNIGSTDADLSHTELCCYGKNNDQPVLLSGAERIAERGFLAIFLDQINAPINLFPGGGTLELLSADTGDVLDSVMYPALGIDQSYIRNTDGTWSISDTPTPGQPNTTGPTPTPTHKATATRHPGGGGSPSTATPTPIGSVFIPTDTPASGIALQNTASDTLPGTGNGENSTTGVPSWVKITLLALLGITLLGVLAWYLYAWKQAPEDEE